MDGTSSLTSSMATPPCWMVPSGNTSFAPTIPTEGSWSKVVTSGSSQSGFTSMSLFRNSRYDPRAFSAPRLQPREKPPFSGFDTTFSRPWAISAASQGPDPSDDPLSTTMISNEASAPCSWMDRMQTRVSSSLLKTGMMTDTCGAG